MRWRSSTMRQGVGVMAGPPDTYISYGKGWANVSNTPFREYKHYVHEGGISTPLIACWPRGIKRKNEIEHQPGQIVDIMATCVELSGATYPEKCKGARITPLAGTGLVPTFSGRSLGRDTLYFEHEGNRAIPKGKWKLVLKNRIGKWELYDQNSVIWGKSVVFIRKYNSLLFTQLQNNGPTALVG